MVNSTVLMWKCVLYTKAGDIEWYIHLAPEKSQGKIIHIHYSLIHTNELFIA